MKTATYEKLCRTITSNARRYKTRLACRLAIARVKRAWYLNGSYGVRKDSMQAAISACQDRYVEFSSLERFASPAD